ncbi:MAG: hypothetical protein IKS35_06560 [Clostridia bacterium]|nr:hypothetical protein [Clostridia bacterium]
MNKLVFKFDKPTGEEDREKVLAFAKSATGYEASFDAGTGELCVFVEKSQDLFQVRDNLVAAAAASGYPVSEMPRILDPDETPEETGRFAEPETVKPEKAQKKMPSVSLGTFVAAICVVILISILTTYALVIKNVRGSYTLGPGIYEQDGTDKYPELTALASLFKAYSYLDLDEEAQMDAVLKAYCRATGDLFATYYNPDEYAQEQSASQGRSLGLGISVTQRTVQAGDLLIPALQIGRVFEGSGAQNAGIQPGDCLVGTGNADHPKMIYEYETMADFKSALRFEKEGDSLEVILYRYSSKTEYETIYATVVGCNYTDPSVFGKRSETDPDVGIVQITEFHKSTPRYLKETMDGLIAQGVERFVFDLRGNPGGDLNSIVATLSFFLNRGDLIITVRDKAGNAETQTVLERKYAGEYKDCSVSFEEIGMYRKYRFSVLVNGSTASAAELFTANFRDYGLGLIVGAKTYGKGSMQKIFPLYSMGMNGAVRLTTNHYLPPSGEDYDGIGISPSEGYAVALSEEAEQYIVPLIPEELDDQLQAAIFAVTAEG